MKWVLVFLGGAIGSVCRYFVQEIIDKYLIIFITFPLGIMCVNVLGSFLFGCCVGVFEKIWINPNLRVFLTVGLLGGFTTFANFAYEMFHFLREGEFFLFFLDTVGNIFVSIVGLFFGYLLTKSIFF